MKMYTALSRVARAYCSVRSECGRSVCAPLRPGRAVRSRGAHASPSRLLLTHTLHDCGPVGPPAGPRSWSLDTHAPSPRTTAPARSSIQIFGHIAASRISTAPRYGIASVMVGATAPRHHVLSIAGAGLCTAGLRLPVDLPVPVLYRREYQVWSLQANNVGPVSLG